MNQVAERFGGYTTKTYTLLATALMLKNDLPRALKIFETALAELKLDGEGSHLLEKGENRDISCLLFNYVKCLCIVRGQNQSGFEFVRNDEVTKKLF